MADFSQLQNFDKIYAQDGVICGMDEAGRGPLAGPVFAACVILKDNAVLEGLDDSKKLSEKKREELFGRIAQACVCYGIASASEEEIDEINILNASMLAMKRAYLLLTVKPDIALIDGNKTPKLDIRAEAVIKGDSKSAAIAAASILAKVSRDRYMLQLHGEYPQYAFQKHKGYPTQLHYELIKRHGICPVHRKSFLKNLGEK